MQNIDNEIGELDRTGDPAFLWGCARKAVTGLLLTKGLVYLPGLFEKKESSCPPPFKSEDRCKMLLLKFNTDKDLGDIAVVINKGVTHHPERFGDMRASGLYTDDDVVDVNSIQTHMDACEADFALFGSAAQVKSDQVVVDINTTPTYQRPPHSLDLVPDAIQSFPNADDMILTPMYVARINALAIWSVGRKVIEVDVKEWPGFCEPELPCIVLFNRDTQLVKILSKAVMIR